MKKTPKNAKVVEALNDALTGELTAINQYFIHAELCQHWGYKRLYAKVRKESIDEMRHAEQLMERILFLDGLPNMQRLGKVNVGETVKEQFELDLKLETEAVACLQRGIVTCQSEGDYVTRVLFEEILKSEEQHMDWLEEQLELMNQVGEQNYMAQQIHQES